MKKHKIMTSNEQTTRQPLPIVQHTEKSMSNFKFHALKTLEKKLELPDASRVVTF